MGRRRREGTHAMDGNKPMILNAIPNTCEADQGRLFRGSEIGETDLERSKRAPELLLVAKSSEQVLVCLLDLSLLGRGRREGVQIGFIRHGQLNGAGGCLWVWSRESVLAQGEQKGSRRERRGRARTNRVLKGQASLSGSGKDAHSALARRADGLICYNDDKVALYPDWSIDARPWSSSRSAVGERCWTMASTLRSGEADLGALGGPWSSVEEVRNAFTCTRPLT